MKKLRFLLVLLIFPTVLTGCGYIALPGESQSAQENVIAIENVIFNESYPDTDQVEAAINEIVEPLLDCRIEIVNCPISQHTQLLQRVEYGGEQLDIINAGLTSSLSNLVTAGTVIPLDDLLDTHGQQLKALEGNLLEATTIDGRIYALCANLYPGGPRGIRYNCDILQRYQVDFPSKPDLASLTEVGAKLQQAGYPGYLTSQSTVVSQFPCFYDLEDFGGDMSYGVIFHPQEGTVIENGYASASYREYCQTIKEWREAGYIPSDTLYSGAQSQTMFIRQEIFFLSNSPNISSLYMAGQWGLPFQHRSIATTSNILTSTQVLTNSWAITRTCENPDKAMEFLNLLYTNPELSNLLQNGREGTDYVRTEGNFIRYPTGKNQMTVGYGTHFSIFGDLAQTYQFEYIDPRDLEYIQGLISEVTTSKTFGYVFDSRSVSDLIASVNEVVELYRPILETGMADNPQATLDEFLQALEQAGINQIIEENQRQLNLWLEAQASQ